MTHKARPWATSAMCEHLCASTDGARRAQNCALYTSVCFLVSVPLFAMCSRLFMLCVRMYAVYRSQVFVNMRCRIHSLYQKRKHHLQRDHLLTCPGNSSQFCDDSWYPFHLMFQWVAPVETICSGMSSRLGTTCHCTRRFVLIISTRLFLASARASANRTLQAMNPSGILSGESAWYVKDVLASSMLASLVSHMRKCNSCVKNGQCTAGVISSTSKVHNCLEHVEL